MRLMVKVACFYVTLCLLLGSIPCGGSSNGFVEFGDTEEGFSNYAPPNEQLVAEMAPSLKDFILDLVTAEEEAAEEGGHKTDDRFESSPENGPSLAHKLLQMDDPMSQSGLEHRQGQMSENIEQLLHLLLYKGRHRLSDQNIPEVNYKMADRKLETPRMKRFHSIRINKRHCWNVADVCCMWNICTTNRRKK